MKLLEIESDTKRRIAELRQELNVDALKRELESQIATLQSKIPPLEIRIAELQSEICQRENHLQSIEKAEVRIGEAHAATRERERRLLDDLQVEIVRSQVMLHDLDTSIKNNEKLLAGVNMKMLAAETQFAKEERARRESLQLLDEQLAARRLSIKEIELKEAATEERIQILHLWEERLESREYDVDMLCERMKEKYKEMFPEDTLNLDVFEPSYEFLHKKDQASG